MHATATREFYMTRLVEAPAPATTPGVYFSMLGAPYAFHAEYHFARVELPYSIYVACARGRRAAKLTNCRISNVMLQAGPYSHLATGAYRMSRYMYTHFTELLHDFSAVLLRGRI